MKRPKALMLLSGGLDSTLATKILLDQGIDVEAVNFTTPFCLCDKCALNKVGKKFGIKIHRLFAGQDYLDMVADPPHGYGSQMNPCIDCRIYMFKIAKEIAKKIGADFIATGEVLGERPFSQRREAMFLIEREAGLKGKVLRPLSAKLLPESEAEEKGLVDREKLFAISGRRRLPQMELAKKLDINDYPCPAGGCLLTDPKFAGKLRDFLRFNKKLTFKDIGLLKLGRHFRIGENKIIVGRNKTENERLLFIAKRDDIPYFEVIGYKGPITLLKGKQNKEVIKKTAAITVRYSDASNWAEVRYKGKKERTIVAEKISDSDLERWRV